MLQEYIEGKNLSQMLDMGWRPPLSEVHHIAAELLATLEYLHQLKVTTLLLRYSLCYINQAHGTIGMYLTHK